MWLEYESLVVGIIIGIAIGIPVGLFIFQFFTSSSPSYRQYSNIEEWDIIRDERGRVRGVKVKRVAKEG